MKTTGLALLGMLLVAAIAPAASAGGQGVVELNGGFSKDNNYGSYNPIGTLGGSAAFGAGYYRVLAPTLDWGVDVALEDLGSADFSSPVMGDGRMSAKVFRINPALRILIGPQVGPSLFVQAGAGLYNVTREIQLDAGGTSSGSDTKFGANFGGGVAFPVGPRVRMSLYGQGHTVATDEATTLYFAFKAGLGLSI
jgi:hypothetical protein